MAGFDNGRGRDGDVQHPHQQYGGHPQQNTRPGGQQPPQYGFSQAADGEPEYFGTPAQHHSYDDNPGHTRAFSIGDAPDAYDPQGTQHPDNISTYRAGQTTAPPAGPRLPWKQLLSGIVMRPAATFWQMRDYQVWAPALTITFLYGLLAVFGFDSAREDVIDATLSNSIPWVLSTAVAVILSGLMLGAVTNALARQLGGDGAWAPTVGLAMLITSITDAPRLVFAIFLGSANMFVQVLGWITWIACAALLTSMVSKSHDLPWPKALGAASIQLIALLVLFKLPVI
ncbi:Yip1 family protein [Streptomyces sp. NPDC088354]|uniref:Yip1 family protein n=1 Tax=unclassified Streptomyces TaxID=2593676 RepID=UPI003807E7AF